MCLVGKVAGNRVPILTGRTSLVPTDDERVIYKGKVYPIRVSTFVFH